MAYEAVHPQVSAPFSPSFSWSHCSVLAFLLFLKLAKHKSPSEAYACPFLCFEALLLAVHRIHSLTSITTLPRGGLSCLSTSCNSCSCFDFVAFSQHLLHEIYYTRIHCCVYGLSPHPRIYIPYEQKLSMIPC